jgi:hypothetical protein
MASAEIERRVRATWELFPQKYVGKKDSLISKWLKLTIIIRYSILTAVIGSYFFLRVYVQENSLKNLREYDSRAHPIGYFCFRNSFSHLH